MPSSEDRLRDFANNLLVVMEKVAKGKSVDRDLLSTLDKLSEVFYNQSKQGKPLSDQQLDLLQDTLILLEKSMIVQDIKGQ